MIRLFKNNMMRIDLRLGPAKKLNAVNANLSQISGNVCIRLQKRREVIGKFTQQYSPIIYAATETARQA